MKLPGGDVVLVRHGDIGVKSSQVQSWMEDGLATNVEAMLSTRDVEGSVRTRRGRLFVRTPTPETAARAVKDVFGVASASPARTAPADLEAIADALAAVAEETYNGGTFAVDARRAGDHAFTSQDVGEVGGRAIWEAVEARFEPAVDLEDPDHRFSVEIREENAYVFRDRFEGPGGFPVGTQAPLVALVSGGIDSPVAAWLAMKRGSPIVPVYLDLGMFGGIDHRTRAIDTIRTVAGYAPGQDWGVRVVPIGDAFQELYRETRGTRMLSVRRLMLQIAAAIARETDAAGIVTGEAIGQKSSQTARNLQVTDRVTDWPIHRPLLSYDKQEIIERARAIGTYETSTIDTGCDQLAPDQPETAAPLERVEAAEPPLEPLVEAALAGTELIPIDPCVDPNGE
ncbi:MAG: tRNA uracil 4-sulfurtransferase ThiI [Halodesulfurarchaeum sp.]